MLTISKTITDRQSSKLCLSVCLPICILLVLLTILCGQLGAYLFQMCLYVWILGRDAHPGRLHGVLYVPAYIWTQASIPARGWQFFERVYVYAYVCMCRDTYMHARIHVCMRWYKYMHTCMHTLILRYWIHASFYIRFADLESIHTYKPPWTYSSHIKSKFPMHIHA